MILLALVGVAEAKRAKPGTELTVSDVGWAATTKSARVKRATDVIDAPDRTRTIGKLAAETRVGWKRIVAGRTCAAWLELEPRGFVCATALEPSAEAPVAVLAPAQVVDATLAQPYLHVIAAGARAYPSVDAIRRGAARKLAGSHFLQRAITDLEFVK